MNILDNHRATNELQALDAAHHLHPFTDTAQINAKGTRVITHASGVHLTDSNGEKLLDGMAGLWCVNIGYGRNELANAAARQMSQLPYYNTFFKTSHPPVIELSSTLARLAPGDLNRVFYAGSGSEANDTNIRFARHYWTSLGKPDKSIIIARKNGYHGSTLGAASLGGMSAMHAQGGLPIADIEHIAQPYWYAEGGDSSPEEFGFACARELEKTIDRLGEENVAAFIAEPVQGAGGVIIPPSTYWPEIQRICDAHEILLVVDEVICGFGRTGNWFGSQTFGIRPDIITIAKGMSSGYLPIGGSIIREEIAEVFGQKGGEFNHGYTYSGHPVACAVAIENLRIMEEEDIVTTVADVTAPYMEERWLSLADHPLVGEARIVGMMGALELAPEKSSRKPFASDEGDVGLICREHSFSNGLIMRHVGDKMVISPPLVITKSEIDKLVDLAHKSLDQTYAELKQRGMLKVSQ